MRRSTETFPPVTDTSPLPSSAPRRQRLMRHMRRGLAGLPPGRIPGAPARRLRFADLAVRPKLMVLHNLFFLVLTASVYLALIPAFEQRVARAKLIEVSLIAQMFSEGGPALQLPHMASYDYRRGSAAAVQLPPAAKSWLDAHP